MNRGTFTFITSIQDETHRFANAYRKQQMRQKSYSSTLVQIPGVGPKLAKALMIQFGSVGAVRQASCEALAQTPGVGPRLAGEIYAWFRREKTDKQKPPGRIGIRAGSFCGVSRTAWTGRPPLPQAAGQVGQGEGLVRVGAGLGLWGGLLGLAGQLAHLVAEV